LEQALGKTGQIGLKSGPVFPLNPRKLFQKLKFWNSLIYTNEEAMICTTEKNG
jgi:hypothetical protein